MSLIIPETFELPSSSVYTNSNKNAAKLPGVFGDLTDGSNGIWEAPLIDDVDFVYAYAGHETLSTANGNVINVYVDSVLASPQPTFDEADNYESQGIISTLTFASDQGNATITVRGKGKPTVSSGINLMTNPIAVCQDVLSSEGFLQSGYDATAIELARQTADAQSYISAGVIVADIKMWTLLQEILISFNSPKTVAYLNGSDQLVLIVDDGTLGLSAGYTVIPRAELKYKQAEMRLEDIINRLSGLYQYNYAAGNYFNETAEANDSLSENLYGTLKPTEGPFKFKWSRNSGNVTTVLNLTLDQFKEPFWFINARDMNLKRLALDIGSVVVATITDLYDSNGNQLINQYFRIMNWSPDTSGINLQLLDTGNFLTAEIFYNGFAADQTTEQFYDGSTTYGNERNVEVI